MATDGIGIAALVAQLDGEDSTAAEDAQAELEAYGAAALEPLLRAAPGFGPFGQLCAIELFEKIGDPRAAQVLIPMLRNQNDTVRAWAAEALGKLGVTDAIEPLREAYDAARRAGTPPDWSEPVWLREALTALGARTEIVPPTIAGLTRTEGILGRCWSAEQLPFVITELADAGQVILYFQYWARWRDTHTWTDTPNWELDWTRPWPDLVEASRRAALAAAEAAGTPAGTVATITWMSEDDR